MNIEKHISELLYRHQCVTVPGFGAFLTEIQSAQFNEVSYTFYPPTKTIAFNSQLKNNDGLLANHISLQEKIGYEAAVEKIQESVEDWKLNLQNNLPIMLHNIGIFTSNAEGNWVFKPFDQVNYLTESFGLSSFISPAIKREVTLQIAPETVIETTEEKEPVALIPETSTRFTYLKYAAIFVMGLGTAGFFGNNYYQNQIAENTRLVQTEVQKEVQSKIQEATFFISNPLPNVTLSVKNTVVKNHYHIVAASFRDKINAQNVCDKLIKSGYDARIIKKNKFGLYPVIYGSFNNYEEAKRKMTEISKNENPEAWILIKDL